MTDGLRCWTVQHARDGAWTSTRVVWDPQHGLTVTRERLLPADGVPEEEASLHVPLERVGDLPRSLPVEAASVPAVLAWASDDPERASVLGQALGRMLVEADADTSWPVAG